MEKVLDLVNRYLISRGFPDIAYSGDWENNCFVWIDIKLSMQKAGYEYGKSANADTLYEIRDWFAVGVGVRVNPENHKYWFALSTTTEF